VVPISSWGRRDNVRPRARDGFGISFAGFVDLRYDTLDEVLSLAGRKKTVHLPGGEQVYMSAYSGAIAYETWNQVVINYYE